MTPAPMQNDYKKTVQCEFPKANRKTMRTAPKIRKDEWRIRKEAATQTTLVKEIAF